MSAHTPGPWSVDAHNNVIAEGCLVAFPSVSAGFAKQEANARLIAAAPETAAERDRLKAINAELLFKLISAANYIDKLGGDSKPYRGTIAKAEGGAA